MTYEPLVPCLSCGRHIRVRESACPFCGNAMDAASEERVIPGATGRLARKAIAVFATTVALAGCGTVVSGNDAGGTSDTSTADQSDAPTADTALRDAGPDDEGGPVFLYGGPPPMDGGVAPPYGIPPTDQ